MHAGKLTDRPLLVTSRMNEDGVIFGDGIEQDFVEFNSGSIARIRRASKGAQLVTR